ncbi:MAG: hypothetical protein ACRD5W_12035 [Candidatus Acidiferrales bacterium]
MRLVRSSLFGIADDLASFFLLFEALDGKLKIRSVESQFPE